MVHIFIHLEEEKSESRHFKDTLKISRPLIISLVSYGPCFFSVFRVFMILVCLLKDISGRRLKPLLSASLGSGAFSK